MGHREVIEMYWDCFGLGIVLSSDDGLVL